MRTTPEEIEQARLVRGLGWSPANRQATDDSPATFLEVIETIAYARQQAGHDDRHGHAGHTRRPVKRRRLRYLVGGGLVLTILAVGLVAACGPAGTSPSAADRAAMNEAAAQIDAHSLGEVVLDEVGGRHSISSDAPHRVINIVSKRDASTLMTEIEQRLTSGGFKSRGSASWDRRSDGRLTIVNVAEVPAGQRLDMASGSKPVPPDATGIAIRIVTGA